MIQPSPVRALIFDLGGVILRTENRASRAALAESLGMTYAALDAAVFQSQAMLQAECGLLSADDAWAAVVRSLNFPGEDVRAFRRQFFGGDQVDFALVAFIRSLRPAYATALLSNTTVIDLSTWISEDLRIPDTFDVVISSASCRLVKPDPAIFHFALDMLHVQPEEAIFVDDAERNITAAAALGIRTVHFKSSTQARQEIQSLLNPTV